MSRDKVLELWVELRASVEGLEKDMQKNATKHNVSAGVRVRKGLRSLRKVAAVLLKETLAADKHTVAARKAKKPAKKKG